MTRTLMAEIQVACDDLYCDPDDVVARGRVQRLLGGGRPVPVPARRRLVKIACDELHDDPADVDAAHRLLLLLAGAR